MPNLLDRTHSTSTTTQTISRTYKNQFTQSEVQTRNIGCGSEPVQTYNRPSALRQTHPIENHPKQEEHLSSSRSRLNSGDTHPRNGRSIPPSLSNSKEFNHNLGSSTSNNRKTSSSSSSNDSSSRNPNRKAQSKSSKHSSKSKTKPVMVSKETDTSMDGVKSPKHQGSQSDPPSTTDLGTTKKLEPPITILQPDPNPARGSSMTSTQRNASSLTGALTDRDRSRSRERKSDVHEILSYDGSNEGDVEELPSNGLALIPTTILSPKPDPRHQSSYRTPRPSNNTEESNTSKLHYAEIKPVLTKPDEPPLNFGTENFCELPEYENVIPFDEVYSEPSSEECPTDNEDYIRPSRLTRDNLRSQNRKTILLPVINSSRTYIFETKPLNNNPIRQSQANGNFYLLESPKLQELDSTFYADISDSSRYKQGVRSPDEN